MGELLNRLRNQLDDFYKSLDNRKKIMIVAGAVVFVLLVAFIIFFATRKEYVPVVQGVTVEEAAAITAKLTELNIPSQDANNQTSVLVNKTDLSKAKMALATNGLLTKKDFTWTDAFAKSSLTMSNEEKNKMYLVAQATALEQAIKTIKGIDDAKVNLYVPADTTYLLNKDYESKASAILTLKQGVTLDPGQVNGIVMIMVNSVKGLDQSRVTLTDSTGHELTKSGNTDTDAYTANSQFELKSVVEERLKKQIAEFLASLYGKDNVKVLASVKLDFNGEVTTRKAFSPPIEGETSGMVRSSSEISETSTNGTAATGAPGTDSNGGAATNTGAGTTTATNYASPAAGGANYQKATKTLNFELNEINTQLTKAKGIVTDITLSIIINQDKLVGKVLTDTQKQDVINLVTAAAGLDTKSVQVSAAPFVDPNAEMQAISSQTKTGAVPIWLIALGVIALIGIIAGVMFFLKKRKADELKRTQEEEALRIAKEAELEAIGLAQDKSSPKYQIEKFIDTNPEIVAQLLRNWINED